MHILIPPIILPRMQIHKCTYAWVDACVSLHPSLSLLSPLSSFSLSLSLSLSPPHTHTHTHARTLSLTHIPATYPPMHFSQSSLTDSLTLQRDPSPAPSRRGSSAKTEGGGGGRQKEGKEKDKLERRLMEVFNRCTLCLSMKEAVWTLENTCTTSLKQDVATKMCLHCIIMLTCYVTQHTYSFTHTHTHMHMHMHMHTHTHAHAHARTRTRTHTHTHTHTHTNTHTRTHTHTFSINNVSS